MSSQLIQRFCGEVERVVAVGAVGGRGDPALGRSVEALRPLAEQVPALAKVVALADRFQAGDDAARTLLQLASAAAQLRGAQAQPGVPEGELEPLPITPLPAPAAVPIRLLYPLVEALGSKKKPPEVLEKALAQENLAADPRLWRPLVKSLANPYVGEVSAKVVGQIGAAVLPLVEAGFKKKGGAAEGVKLRAIAAIRGVTAEPLLRECIQAGSPEVQVAAVDLLRQLPHVDLADIERIAQALFDATGSYSARVACLEILAKTGTRPALRRVIQFGAQSADAALTALQHAAETHPDELFAAAREELGAAGPGSFAQNEYFLLMLGGVPHPGAREYLVEQLGSATERIRRAAAKALNSRNEAQAFAAVAAATAGDEQLAGEYVRAVFGQGTAVAFETLSKLIPPLPRRKQGLLGKAAAFFSYAPVEVAPPTLPPQLEVALESLTAEQDPRWFDPVAELARAGVPRAFMALVRLAGERARDVLEECVPHGGASERFAVDALGHLSDPSIAPFLAGRLEEALQSKRIEVYLRALGKLGSPAAAPGLQKLLQRDDLDKFTRDFATLALSASTQERKQ